MIAPLALMLFAPVAGGDDDIVVNGRQPSYGMVRRDGRGGYACSLNRSTGNAGLDARFCRVATACVRDGARQLVDVHACIDQRKPTVLADMRRAFADGAR